ncbi:glycoside hydrolase family 95 protein [Streptomyces pathocidini]|nr:glycoside hydrolase family 95 protein [Streptomyces pathocidini]
MRGSERDGLAADRERAAFPLGNGALGAMIYETPLPS